MFRSTPGFDRLPSDMPDPQSENSLCRHEPEMIGADCFRKQFAMLLQRESARHFDRRPKFVFGTRSHRIGGAQNDMAGERIALQHPIESRIDFLGRDFPGDERAIREIGASSVCRTRRTVPARNIAVIRAMTTSTSTPRRLRFPRTVRAQNLRSCPRRSREFSR